MLKTILRRFFHAVMAAVVGLYAADIWAATEVNVEKAGTLSTLVTGTETSLVLTGNINGTDIKFLRQMINNARLTSLDLTDARIVKGGEAYYNTYTTEDNVIGNSMFTECSKLRTVKLPATVTAIQGNAFSRTGISKVDIPNNVTHLGGDAFAYCSSLTTVTIGSRVSRLDQGVFYQSAVTLAEVKPLAPPSTPAYLFSTKPTIRVYTEALEDYRESGWAQYGTIVGKLESKYPLEPDSSAIVNALCATYFEDAACTRLKAEYQAMTDEALAETMTAGGMPDYMVAIATKLKNDSWADYEKDFRIHDYKAYSDANYWNEKMMASGGSYMGNPTGICTQTTAPLYVFVDSDVPSDATLYLAGCVGNELVSNAKSGKKLTKGLNIVEAKKDALYYIIYTADTKSQTKTLDQWPAIRVHIEGGAVNGYYDVSRHSDTDYLALLRKACHERFTVRGGHALFNFKTSTYKTVWPKTIDRSICWFDSLAVWQRELMGMCASVANGERKAAPHCLSGGEAIYPIYYNNPNFAIEGVESDAGYANSSAYRTSYNTVACIRNSFDVSRWEMDDWCSAHECGHNNQRAIHIEAGTEVSNNLFSNVIRYLDGLVTSNGSPLSTVMNEYANHIPYYVRPVDSQLRMYYQLYLYYHQAQKNTSFYPELFRKLRQDPLGPRYSNTNETALKFVRKVCEVAQEDLTDFFTAWGFFEPVTNLPIEDYGSHTMTVRQADISKTLAEISRYPKNRTILFVEDRIDYVPTTGFLTKAGQKRRDSEMVGQCGHLGQFTDYLSGTSQPSSYTYLQTDSLYAMLGTGGVGFLMLDSNNKIRYAANARKFCIPTSVTDYTIYSIDADGTLHEAALTGSGSENVFVAKVGTLADTLSAQAIKATISGSINGTDIKYIRQLINEGFLSAFDLTDTRILGGGEAYYESNKSITSGIGDFAFYYCKQLISAILPSKITKIGSNAFARSGLTEARIPDLVTAIGGDAFAYCDQLRTVVIGSRVRSLDQGAFYSSPVKHAYVKPITPPTISLYLFSSKPIIHVYARALAAYQKSGWAEFGTLVGDLDDHEDILSPVAPVIAEDQPAAETVPVYDLQGRRVNCLQPGTIYVRKGKKFMVR